MEKLRKYTCVNVVSTNLTGSFSRIALLEWINSLSPVKVRKVESLSSGFFYCYCLDHLFPGCLSLTKVKQDATQEHEFIKNLKYLQASLRKIGCDKDVPITRLSKGRFQDNLEFLQWFKKFYDVNFHTCNSDNKLQSSNKQNLSYSIADDTYIESEMHDKTVELVASYDHTTPISQFASDDSVRVKSSVSKSLSTVAKSSTEDFGNIGKKLDGAGKHNFTVKNLEAELMDLQEKIIQIPREAEFYHRKLLLIKNLFIINPEPQEPDATTLVAEIYRILDEALGD